MPLWVAVVTLIWAQCVRGTAKPPDTLNPPYVLPMDSYNSPLHGMFSAASSLNPFHPASPYYHMYNGASVFGGPVVATAAGAAKAFSPLLYDQSLSARGAGPLGSTSAFASIALGGNKASDFPMLVEEAGAVSERRAP